jgi:hypothetical protein
MREKRGAYRSPVRRLEGKRPLGRSRHRWKENTKLHLKEVGWEGVDWIHLAHTEANGKLL